MKLTSFFILNLFLCTQLGAQERFYTFVPGWRGTSIIEQENGYSTIALGEEIYSNQYHNFITTSLINNNGIVIDSSNFIIDSLYSTEVIVSLNKFLKLDDEIIVVGRQQYDQYAFYGLIIWYNEDLSVVNNYITYNLEFATHFKTINHPNDSTLIIGGNYNSGPTPPSSSKPILINMDMEGNIRWIVDYPCGSGCRGFVEHVLETPDKGYLITTEQLVDQPAQWDDLFYQKYIKVDSLGVIQWEYSAGDFNDFAYSGTKALLADDGNVLIAYSDYSVHVFPYNQTNDDATIYLEKLNMQDGSSMFIQPIYETTPWSTQLTQMIYSPDGNIIITGVVDPLAILLKITPSGDPLWYREIDPFDDSVWNVPFGITTTSDGGYICAGEYIGIFNNALFQSAYVLKVDEYGCLEPGCQLTDDIDQTDDVNASQLKVFPNPFSGNFTIYLPERKKGEITVMDITGKIVLTKQVSNEQAIPIDISRNVSGLYLVQFTSNKGEVYQIKIIKK